MPKDSWPTRRLPTHIRLHRCQVQSTSTKYVPHHEIHATPANRYSQEVKLSSNNAERELYDSLAEVYSIIITLDALEKAYLKDSVSESEYTDTCNRLLKQYKSNLQDETVSQEFGDLETFMRVWEVRNVGFDAQLPVYILPSAHASGRWNAHELENDYE